VRRLALAVALAALGMGILAVPTMADRNTAAPSAGKASSGTKVVVRASEFGPMLWGPGQRAVYVFQRDRRNDSNCFGGCARAWPPLLTRGKPVAGNRVQDRLLGTIRRPNGKRQVTYAGQPLYKYAHEGPGQVLCHNVNLNGGLWWVIGPDGKPRP
jgi:predicted lipoprotein with Yx(FWY)xxD motif